MKEGFFGALAVALASVVLASAGGAGAPGRPRLLVLSAFPAELDRLIVSADVQRSKIIDGRSFYVGRLAGNEVVLALTGIGLVNAEKTTRDALASFHISGIVFSGVSGTKYRIADVMVPARWTEDDGKTWIPVDPEMLDVAQQVATSSPPLDSCAPLGDPACIGVDPDLVRTSICIEGGPPQVFVGGDGRSSDPFGGKAFPCVPLGGDVFGCEACRAPKKAPPDFIRFLKRMPAILDPNLVNAFFEFQNAPVTGTLDAEDMETAAVARVAQEAGKPFIGFRAASDGAGDPLMLPGFPIQFLVFRQLAADNAAIVTLAFLEAWAAHGDPSTSSG